MWLAARAIAGWAHPDGGSVAVGAHERLVDEILRGPLVCRASVVQVQWRHAAGSFVTEGARTADWRFDHRIWRLDRQQDVDPASDLTIAPLLFGTAIHADLSYPITRHRRMVWPRPVATLPVRLFGEVTTVAVDALADGEKRIVVGFGWDGWKEVNGERAVRFGARMVPLTASLDVTDRWPNGCRVRSVGSAEIGPEGLPTVETWELTGKCPFGTDWRADWVFTFAAWAPCTFSGPAVPGER